MTDGLTADGILESSKGKYSDLLLLGLDEKGDLSVLSTPSTADALIFLMETATKALEEMNVPESDLH